MVYLKASDNKAYKAICTSTAAEADVLGIVTQTGGISSNGTGTVTITGTVTNGSWNWTINKWLYLDSTSGALTQTIPTVNGQYVVPIGLALSATEIYIQPMTGWVVADGDIALGCKKVSFNQDSGTVSIVTPPANAIITQVTVVVSSAASASGGTLKIGTSGSLESVMASTVIDLTQVGNHVYDPYVDVGASPSEHLLTVTAGAQTFSGIVYFNYIVPNVKTGIGGTASLSFTEATSSPALLVDLPENVVVSRCVVVVDAASSAGTPSVSIGTVGDADLLFDETDCDLLTQGIYLYDSMVETSGSIYLTLVPDSQQFEGRVYMEYKVVS